MPVVWAGPRGASVLAYDGGGNCNACLRTFLRYSARFAVNDWKASDCAGLFSLGVSNSSCTARHQQRSLWHNHSVAMEPA